MQMNLKVYKAVLNSMEHGFVFMTPDGAIAAFNAAACRILGVTADQLAGRSAFDAAWGAVREDGSEFPSWLFPIGLSLKTGKPCFGVVMGIRIGADRVRWLLINSDVVHDETSNDTIGAVASFSDITTQINHKRYLESMLEDMKRSTREMSESLIGLTSGLTSLAREIAESNAKTLASIGAGEGLARKHAEIVAEKTESLSRLLARSKAA